jgi:hypothetical protein
VNDVPVAWGGSWSTRPELDSLYGLEGGAWGGSGCFENCEFNEDSGLQTIYFGGRDIEFSDLTVEITDVQCSAGASFRKFNGTTWSAVPTASLLGPLPQKLVRGDKYELQGLLQFESAANTWNKKALNELAHPNDVSGAETEFYCKIRYVVDDGTDKSLPKDITINVRQVNDQPIDLSDHVVLGFEELDTPIKINAVDIESDSFVMKIESCTANGFYYYPSSTQSAHIISGLLDTTISRDILFDLSNPVNCNNSGTRSHLSTDVSGKGWFVLFVGDKDKSGTAISGLTYSFNDNTLPGQPARTGSVVITLKAINDAPVISSDFHSPGVPSIVNVTNPLVASVSTSGSALRLSIADVDANLGQNFAVSIQVIGFPAGGSVKDVTIMYPDGQDIVFPDNVPQNAINFENTLAQTNNLLRNINFQFLKVGEYTIEIVVADKGSLGFCPPNVPEITTVTVTYPATNDVRNLYPDGFLLDSTRRVECNRATVARIVVTAQQPLTISAGMAAGFAVGTVALGAIIALVAVNKTKPVDTGAWEALDNAVMETTNSNALFTQSTTRTSNSLYVASTK